MACHDRSWPRTLPRLCAVQLLLLLLLLLVAASFLPAATSAAAHPTTPTPTAPPTVATHPSASAALAVPTVATSVPVHPIHAPPGPRPTAAATVTATADPSAAAAGIRDDDDDEDNRIRESVVISRAVDTEREAQDLYDKELRQYDLYGTTARNICAIWAQRGCQCTTVANDELTLSCRSVGLEMVPLDLPVEIVKLDLGYNNISTLFSKSFDMTPNLEELVLSDNTIGRIDVDAFLGLHKLKRLSLHNCGLTAVPAEALRRIKGLQTLQLNGNAIRDLNGISLVDLSSLRTLRLEGNMITAVPTEALIGLTALEALNMASNHLFNINEGDFPVMSNLNYLLLKRNRISEVETDAISNLTKLKILDLDENLLTTVPVGLDKLIHLQELYLSGNRIKWISKNDLPRNIVTLELKANPLVGVKAGAMQNMPRLRKLVLSDARNLRDLPSLEGCAMLEILRMDRASLSNIPSDICLNTPRLKSLELKSNKLRSIPDLNNCKDLRILDLSGNRIDSVHGKPFKGLIQLHDLLMSHNEIGSIPYDAFVGIPKLQSLDLEGNRIGHIHDEAFSLFTQLEDLNLGNNVFPNLPRNGMHRILHLKTFNNPKLREFPPPETFPRIQTLVLSYAYHCCPFIPLVTMGSPSKHAPLQERVLFPTDNEFDMSLWNNSQTDIWPQLHNLSKKFGSQINELWDSFGQDFTYPGNLPAYVEEYFEEETIPTRPFTSLDMAPGSVQCLPMPGPFLPCQDLFDWWTLRCGVWVVFLLAMLGNGTVVFVLIFSRSKMDVPRFLVCNLAAADFFMGLYLGILAVVDASTLGEFRMYAIPWQMSAGCQLSGFLAVLSSELSVYTLAVITLERNYAITHAMHLNKRLSLRHAGYIMIVGWIFSLTMAMLPLIGISDYRKFAVCLPFETTNRTASLVYVVFLMFINGVAFLILMGCYLKMYCAIRGSQAWNSNDSRIAKRMALLVFTDFICWSPIAFLSLTAVFGLHLISLEYAKVFTVFVLPLNSCCNPFLYAIMTKQFKKDCVLICKAIEESRVTRGIGRCRHSSNFSNRQTPANTNSLAERSSKELPALGVPGQIHTCSCAKLLDNHHQHHQQPQLQPLTHANQPMAAHPLHHPHSHQHHHHHLHHPHAHPELTRRGGIAAESTRRQRGAIGRAWDRLLCKHSLRRSEGTRRDIRSDQYAYQIAEIQQKQYKRAGSVSSENFSSSRSDSWRHGPPHHCGIPLRMLDPRRRHSSWLVTRKTSQDSNLSSSRNDSSASATTASTSTFRMSRSSASGSTPMQSSIGAKPSIGGTAGINCSMASGGGSLNKPRLVRQQAVQEESTDLSSSPPRLSVRFLPTIPSAADSSVILDDESQYVDSILPAGTGTMLAIQPTATATATVATMATTVVVVSVATASSAPKSDEERLSPPTVTTPFYAVLQSGTGTPLTTLSSPKSIRKQPP